MEAKVGIVLVNYNGEKFQNDCIATLKNMTYKNYKIFVVDNGSSDNSINLLKQKFNDVKIIETGKNNGAAKGNNIGIKEAIKDGCEYILLLNNDTEIDKDMLSNMLKKADCNTLVTCKMYYYEPKNLIWCAGGAIDWNKAITKHFGNKEIDNGQFDNSKFIEYTPTCCLLIHKSIFDKVGFMDENYFMYYDDTDFIVRVNNLGYKIWYESSAKLWHKVSSSSGGSESKVNIYYGNRNRLYFIKKNMIKKLRPLIYFYCTRVVKCIKYFFIKPKFSKLIIQSIIDYKEGKFGYRDISNI